MTKKKSEKQAPELFMEPENDDRFAYIAGYTSGGAPYGIFEVLMRKIILMITLLLLAACASHPEQKKRYQVTGTLYQLVPIRWEQINISTTVAGTVLREDKVRPAGWTKMQLERENIPVAETMTDASGHFQLRGDLPNGNYTIKIADDENVCFYPIVINSSHVEDLSITLCH